MKSKPSNQCTNKFGYPLNGQLEAQFMEQLRNKPFNQLHDQLGSQLWNQLRSKSSYEK